VYYDKLVVGRWFGWTIAVPDGNAWNIVSWIMIVMLCEILTTGVLFVRSDPKESRESSGKLKTKHKLSDASGEGERPHKESRHESYPTTEKTQHREEKRNDVRTSADKAHDSIDARSKDRSHRTDVGDTGDTERGHRATERDQPSADDQTMSGNRSGDGHRRSADTAAGKPADERGK